MKVRADVVNNSGPNTVESVLRELGRTAESLNAVVAFATKAGVDAALPHIRRIARRGHACITVGLYQGITEPSALRTLDKAKQRMAGRLDVRISRVLNLHRKVYVFGLAKETAVLVGSSNLSMEGLRSEGEFNVLLRFPTAHEFLRYLPELIDPNDLTQPLTQQLISDYECRRNRPQSGIGGSQLSSLLGPIPRPSLTLQSPPREAGWLRHGIVGLVRSGTEMVVAQETDWDRRGWEWCTIDRDDRVRRGDLVLLFDHRGKEAWARVVVVKDATRTAVPTPDGHCFFAYIENRRRYRRRQMSKTLFGSLAAAGWLLSKTQSRNTRRLSQPGIKAVKQIFER